MSITDAAIPWETEPKWTLDLLAERTSLPRERLVDAVVRSELPVALLSWGAGQIGAGPHRWTRDGPATPHGRTGAVLRPS